MNWDVSPSREIAASVAFEVGGERYTWGDVLIAATLWGDWADLRERATIALRQLRDARDGSPSEEEIEAAADEFRYARDLISADETDAWLGRRGLEFEDLLQYVERVLVEQREAAPAESPVASAPLPEAAIESAAWANAVLSGILSQLADKLAAQAALHERVKGAVVPDQRAGAAGPVAPDRTGSAAHACPSDLAFNGARDVPVEQRLRRVRHLTECFNEHCRDLITPAAVREEIHAHRIDWMRVRLRYALFRSDDAAREALLCIREDHCALDEVAGRAGTQVREDCFLLDQIDEDVRDSFLGARPNDLLGPLRWGEAHGVFAVMDKQLPSDDDAALRTRAIELLQGRLMDEEVRGRVRWLERL